MKPTASERRKMEMQGQVQTISRPCAITGRLYAVIVKQTDYDRWKDGTLPEKSFAYLSANDLQFILHDLTPAEFDRMYGFEE